MSTNTEIINDMQKKARKPKPVNFIDKKTFRLGEVELENLAKGSEVFEEDPSDYVRRLLQINPRKVKALLTALEDMEVNEDENEEDEEIDLEQNLLEDSD